MEKEPIVPKVLMGATKGVGSDRYPFTIWEVSLDKKRIGVSRDEYNRIDNNGQSESQKYEFFPCKGSALEYYTLRKNGTWVKEGYKIHSEASICIGHRDAYQDPSF